MNNLPQFVPVPVLTRRDQVAEALRRSILSAQMRAGTQLVESHLAAQFGVSRGLLREAIRELIEAGLVVNRPYAGTFVVDLDGDDLRDVYEIRRAIEAQAYTRVWPNRDARFRTELQQRFDAMISTVESGDLAEGIRAESRFHGLVYERCGNRLMPTLWQQMSQKIQLGFAICQVAQAPKLDFRENHLHFLDRALGDDLAAMLVELDKHLLRGLATLDFAVREPASRP